MDNIINVKEIVANPRFYTAPTQTEVMSNKVVILYLDSEDIASCKYVKFKLNDIQSQGGIACPIDIAPLLASTSEEEYSSATLILRREIKHAMNRSDEPLIPYIIQIPSSKERLKLANSKNFEAYMRELHSEEFEKFLIEKFPEIGREDRRELFESSDVDHLNVNAHSCVVYKAEKLINEEDINRAKKKPGHFYYDTLSKLEMPATPKGIIMLIAYLIKENIIEFKRQHEDIDTLAGLKIAIVGCNSRTTGAYLRDILPKFKATVSMYHSGSKIENDEFANYDIVISCVGRPAFITKEVVGDNGYPKLLIDVGVSVNDNGKVIGDFALDVRECNHNFVTPYIGGVGLLTRKTLSINIDYAFDECRKIVGRAKKQLMK